MYFYVYFFVGHICFRTLSNCSDIQQVLALSINSLYNKKKKKKEKMKNNSKK